MTKISSQSGEITFGPGLPTAIIGERINPTNRARLAQELAEGNLDIVIKEALAQKQAGAHVLDVNVGAPGVNEIEMLPKAVMAVLEATSLPICIDSSSPDALIAALKVYPHRALVNSVTAKAGSMETILPVIKEHKAAVIGMAMGDEGIPSTAEGRLRLAEQIVDKASSYGIPRDDIVIDCLILAVGVENDAALITLETLRRASDELGLATCLGASNVSFGMPNRRLLNLSFLPMAIASGVSAAIVDPTAEGVTDAIVAADFLSGKDPYGRRYLTRHRQKQKE